MRLWLPKRRGLVIARQLPKHYSTSDWDFSGTNWTLDNVTYHSSPSSLTGTQPPVLWCRVLCRETTTQNIRQGRLATWVYRAENYESDLYFGSNSPLGSGDPTAGDYYIVEIMPLGAYVKHYSSGVQDWAAASGLSVSSSAWTLVRVTWWNSYNLQNVPAIAIQTSLWNGTSWIDGNINYDTTIAHMANPTNRVGLAFSDDIYFDDTEIWCTG